MKENVFTTKLIDVIVPKDLKHDNDEEPIEYIFIVMEYIENDLAQVLEEVSSFND